MMGIGLAGITMFSILSYYSLFGGKGPTPDMIKANELKYEVSLVNKTLDSKIRLDFTPRELIKNPSLGTYIDMDSLRQEYSKIEERYAYKNQIADSLLNLPENKVVLENNKEKSRKYYIYGMGILFSATVAFLGAATDILSADKKWL